MEFEARRISVRFQLDASVEKVPFDTSKCRVVLSNLLINAMKFSDPDTSLSLVRSVWISMCGFSLQTRGSD